MLSFLKSTPARVATLLLLVQSGLLYSSIRPEFIPNCPPLSTMPVLFGGWHMVQEGFVDKETLEVLKADDTLTRQYAKEQGFADLFVASFRSQRTGKAPHSPKNCLPGSGWEPVSDSQITIDVGRPAPIAANRYIISHGDVRELVYYWYQSRDRAVAGEFKAKFWVVADAIRYNRTDTALVRVIVPILNRDERTADRQAADFVRSLYAPLLLNLPS